MSVKELVGNHEPRLLQGIKHMLKNLLNSLATYNRIKGVFEGGITCIKFVQLVETIGREFLKVPRKLLNK